MKARDYLAGKGLAIAGARGKFSNAAKAELDRVMGEGMKFSDWPKGSTAPVPSKSGGPTKAVPVPSAGDSPYLYPSDFRFPEDEYVAKDAKGKRYSMRECCNRCRVSLTNHMCDTPSVLGETVTIVRR
jgi:hypothetical protein